MAKQTRRCTPVWGSCNLPAGHKGPHNAYAYMAETEPNEPFANITIGMDTLRRLARGEAVMIDGVALFAADDFPVTLAQWRPIETAPKDGKTILGWADEGIDFFWYEPPQPDGLQEMGHDGGWWNHGWGAMPGRHIGNPDYFREPEGQPTHWMPLPDPPAAASQQDSEVG